MFIAVAPVTSTSAPVSLLMSAPASRMAWTTFSVSVELGRSFGMTVMVAASPALLNVAGVTAAT